MSLLNTAVNLLMAPPPGAAGYSISRSLRFNSSDSAYLSRTPSSAGNRKTWTWSGWVKRSSPGIKVLFDCRPNNSYSELFVIYFDSDDTLVAQTSGVGGLAYNKTSAVFRDYSAWYHVVIALDTTNAASNDRLVINVNGVRQPTSSYTAPTQNSDLGINQAALHTIGTNQSIYFDGYLAEIHFIDGQALTPSSFTEVSATTGQLIPKAYTGTFGTNGFWLKFSDNSTSAALGTDYSGNGNTWTVNNITAASAGTVNYASPSNWTQIGTGLNTGSSYFNAWDGNTTGTATVFLTDVSPNNDVAYTFPGGGVAVSSYVRLWVGVHSSNERQWRVNSQSYQSNNTTGYLQYNFTGTLTSIDGYNTWPGTNSMALYAVEVDGTVLTYIPGQNVDSLVDTPTSYGTGNSGGDVRGNYCTWNPLASNASMTLTNGNLESKYTTGSWVAALGSIGVNNGRWYWEITLGDSTNHMYGVAFDQPNLSSHNTSMYGYYNYDGSKWTSGIQGSAYGNSSTTGDVIGIALDLSAGGTSGAITFYKNGVSMGAAFSNLDCSKTYVPWVLENGNSAGSYANFGQRAFAYTAPSGFKALCDTNLPAPVVAKPNTVMDVALYTGNGSARSITGLGFSPDMVWIKSRSAAGNHRITDIVRGATKELSPDLTNAEGTDANGVTSFDANGFSLGISSFQNGSGTTYAAWTWDAGSSTVTNTQGSITSSVSVRANATAGFSVVTYTGTATNCTVGHGLGVAPDILIAKRRDSSGAWYVYHRTLGALTRLQLNETSAATVGTSFWNSTNPTSTVFSIGSDSQINANGGTFVVYAFAPVVGYSSFGSYTGNGSADGPFVYTGFRPRFLLIKYSSGVNSWMMQDSARDTYNPCPLNLTANGSGAENDYKSSLPNDMLSNGFKLRNTNDAWNGSGGTYIYAAFAESPFQFSRAR